MPYYLNVDTISFVDKNGDQFAIKDVREIPDQTIIEQLELKKNDMLDEIASRRDIYGEDAEQDTFNLHDANVEKLLESNFDLSKLKKLKIPVRQ